MSEQLNNAHAKLATALQSQANYRQQLPYARGNLAYAQARVTELNGQIDEVKRKIRQYSMEDPSFGWAETVLIPCMERELEKKECEVNYANVLKAVAEDNVTRLERQLAEAGEEVERLQVEIIILENSD